MRVGVWDSFLRSWQLQVEITQFRDYMDAFGLPSETAHCDSTLGAVMQKLHLSNIFFPSFWQVGRQLSRPIQMSLWGPGLPPIGNILLWTVFGSLPVLCTKEFAFTFVCIFIYAFCLVLLVLFSKGVHWNKNYQSRNHFYFTLPAIWLGKEKITSLVLDCHWG